MFNEIKVLNRYRSERAGEFYEAKTIVDCEDHLCKHTICSTVRGRDALSSPFFLKPGPFHDKERGTLSIRFFFSSFFHHFFFIFKLGFYYIYASVSFSLTMHFSILHSLFSFLNQSIPHFHVFFFVIFFFLFCSFFFTLISLSRANTYRKFAHWHPWCGRFVSSDGPRSAEFGWSIPSVSFQYAFDKQEANLKTVPPIGLHSFLPGLWHSKSGLC